MEQQDDYVATKKVMEKGMLPMNLISLDNFHQRKLHPGEVILLYVHDLRKLLSHALPDAAKEPLLLHQFLAGIPEAIVRQLRVSGEVNILEKVMTCARLVMTIDPDPVAAVADKNQRRNITKLSF